MTRLERISKLGPQAATWSIFQLDPGADAVLLGYLDRWFPGRDALRILEIGTCRGVSACILAERGFVTTLDVATFPETQAIIDLLGPRARIMRLVGPAHLTRPLLRGWQFDFAFIDSMHEYESVMEDFAFCTLHTRRILLHDYCAHHLGCVKAVDELRSAVKNATWETGGNFAACALAELP